MASSDVQERPKLIDLRFVVDLVLTRYYVVLLVGRDQRKKPRPIARLNRYANLLAAILLLLGLNVLVTSILLLVGYLLKSLLGIDLLPGHLGQC